MEAKPENYVPEDIAAEILVRIPVKSLVRFTAVCKSWYSLIKNPSFIDRHLKRTLSKQGEDPCFLNVHDHLGTVINDEKTLTTRAKFELPCDFTKTEILGSCNGLLCLKIIYGTGVGIFLYNPSIQHLKFVESFRNLEVNSVPEIVYGLGYCERSNDHRLVKLEDSPSNKVEVYSLRTDSWHELQQSPPRKLFGHCRSTTGMYYNGSTHWWTSTEDDDDDGLYYLDSIVAFDFNEEVFRDIALPSELHVDMDDFVQINEFQGSLAILLWNDLCLTSNLWVMDEYGVSESWNKKFSNILFKDGVHPRGFTKTNGSVVLRYDGDYTRGCLTRARYLGLYHLQNRQEWYSEYTLFVKDIFDFVESLLLLDHENVLQKYQSIGNLFYWNID